MTVLRFEERSSSRTQNLVTACRDRKRSAKGGNGINSESSSGFMPEFRPCASAGSGYRLTGKAHAGAGERAGGSASASAVKVGTGTPASRILPFNARSLDARALARGRG